MDSLALRRSLVVTALILLAVCLCLGTATYAWFTFDPYTNVTPMEGKIADGDTNLLISESENGPFDVQCALNPAHMAAALYPVSTANLNTFYAASRQSPAGIVTNYTDVTDTPQRRLIHGTVYLQCMGKGCDVFFDETTLNFGTDPQVLAAGRLGLKITGADGNTTTYLFRLDDMGSVDGASSRITVAAADPVVVERVNEAGEPTYGNDPALPIGRYCRGTAGREKLLTMQTDEIASVEYWLYLEGCDPECINAVQTKEILLQLGFAGEPIAQS